LSIKEIIKKAAEKLLFWLINCYNRRKGLEGEKMKQKNEIRIFFQFLMIGMVFLVSACGGKPTDILDDDSSSPVPENVTEITEQFQEPTNSFEVLNDGLPADPQKLSFSASDGFELNGIFYPTEIESQPLVVLMHWAPGDQNDWVEIAYWLQNRGLGGNSEYSDKTHWLDPSWFPEMEPQVSYNVFTFTFRTCENGCKQFKRDEWYLDAQAAVEYAYGLDGIDKEKIVMIGASIGSDGAADGCAYLNTKYPNACKGALAFSPGNYLTVDFGGIVKQLGAEDNPKPIWCFYSESDPESAAVCGDITDNNYQVYPYAGDSVFSNGHGMNLITPKSDPNPLEKLLDFLKMVF
jgi:hypothetical protein